MIAIGSEYAVRPEADCTYNGNGASWACAEEDEGTGAYDGLNGAGLDNNTSTSPRGHVYYLADGDYGGNHLLKNGGAPPYIYIKKAIESDHGPSDGWVSTLGDGQATFNPAGGTPAFKFMTNYWDLDGQKGYFKGQTEAYGFVSRLPAVTATETFRFDTDTDDGPDYIRIAHFESDGQKPDVCGHFAIRGPEDNSDNVTLQYVYFHGHGSMTIAQDDDHDNWLIEHSVLADNHNSSDSETCHAEILFHLTGDDWVIRYNWVEDFRSTGGVMMGSSDGWKLYGNLFIWTEDFGTTSNNGAVGTWSNYGATNAVVYNNTWVDCWHDGSGGAPGGVFPVQGSSSNIISKNNLWYYSEWNQGNIVSRSYNAYGGCPDSCYDYSGESNVQWNISDPFIDHSGGNYDLSGATSAGDDSIGAEYNTDGIRQCVGGPNASVNTRGSDGNWDRGAYEYDSGSVTVSMNAASLALAAKQLDVQPGGVMIGMSAASGTSSPGVLSPYDEEPYIPPAVLGIMLQGATPPQ